MIKIALNLNRDATLTRVVRSLKGDGWITYWNEAGEDYPGCPVVHIEFKMKNDAVTWFNKNTSTAEDDGIVHDLPDDFDSYVLDEDLPEGEPTQVVAPEVQEVQRAEPKLCVNCKHARRSWFIWPLISVGGDLMQCVAPKSFTVNSVTGIPTRRLKFCSIHRGSGPFRDDECGTTGRYFEPK